MVKASFHQRQKTDGQMEGVTIKDSVISQGRLMHRPKRFRGPLHCTAQPSMWSTGSAGEIMSNVIQAINACSLLSEAADDRLGKTMQCLGAEGGGGGGEMGVGGGCSHATCVSHRST